uniref:Uncharacterized protein n=1 Tax=Caenorhabditis japonica TaxID=281687 RepID=A0A8R1HY99_CAEJA
MQFAAVLLLLVAFASCDYDDELVLSDNGLLYLEIRKAEKHIQDYVNHERELAQSMDMRDLIVDTRMMLLAKEMSKACDYPEHSGSWRVSLECLENPSELTTRIDNLVYHGEYREAAREINRYPYVVPNILERIVPTQTKVGC